MKKFFLLFCFIFYLVNLFAQGSDSSNRKDKIGLTVSVLGESDIFRFQKLDGDARYDSRRFITFGVNYLHAINKRLDIETGMEFSSFSTTRYPGVNPDADLTPSFGDLNSLTIPVTVRAIFWKYFYVNGGVLVDMDISKSSGIDSQSGIGSMLGFGWKYEFNSGWEITINPYSKLHSMISFSNSMYPQRFLESGIRLGAMIPLK